MYKEMRMMSCHVISFHIMSCRVMSCHIISYHAISSHFMSHCASPDADIDLRTHLARNEIKKSDEMYLINTNTKYRYM